MTTRHVAFTLIINVDIIYYDINYDLLYEHYYASCGNYDYT